MTDPRPLLVGAVAYTPAVVPIWEGIRDYFTGSPAEMDFVLFSNYGRQVEALLDGMIDIAWNTNLAWVRSTLQSDGRAVALAMRDVDSGYRSLLVAPPGSGLAGVPDLAGRRLAVGTADSAQATIMPQFYLRDAGVLGEIELVRHDSDLGKHGDTGRSEHDAMAAVLAGRADAAAVGVSTWDGLGSDDEARARLEVFWVSPAYSHCTFTALDSADRARLDAWVEHLLRMDWQVPEHRRILELEGLRRCWIQPDLAGYADLFAAVEQLGVAPTW